MSQKSSKAQQGAVTPISIRFDGGLNLADSPTKIADNELCRALNVIYDSQSGTLITRPGTVCVTALPLAAPLRKIYYYEKSATLKWLVGVSGGNLYYLDTAAWVLIGALAGTAVIPSFVTFNTKLLIADGGTNIKTWDGTTFGALADGLSATAITQISNRVVINSKSDADLVTFSGVEDETMWDTADLTNPAIGLRAGFGDNMPVNAFGVFGSDLIVSKKGDASKRFMRISTAGVPTSWTVNLLSDNNCSQNAHTITAAFNNVYFADTNGVKSIKGVTEYGDLQVDMAGSKINTQLTSAAVYESAYLPAFTAVWYLTASRVYAYHKTADGNGNVVQAFTDMQFSQGAMTSLAVAGDVIYLAGLNGYLYKIDETSDRDEITPLVYSDYPTVVVSKRFSFFGGGIVRKTSVELKALENFGGSSVMLKANTMEKDGTLLKTISVLSAAQGLDTATGDLADATTLLSDMSGSAWVETSTNRVRGSSIQFQIDSSSGRFGLEALQAEIALVGS